MGVYWKWICRAKKEQLDPKDFGENIKRPEEAVRTNQMMVMACRFGSWRGQDIALVNDYDQHDNYYDTEYWDTPKYKT
jgi:hypothetical protein